eukprot:3134518-Prymnesium_polylepis.1
MCPGRLCPAGRARLLSHLPLTPPPVSRPSPWSALPRQLAPCSCRAQVVLQIGMLASCAFPRYLYRNRHLCTVVKAVDEGETP